MILELGNEYLIPGDPAAKSRLAILHACPTHHVAIGGSTYCIVSYMPSPAVTEPPGLILGRMRKFSYKIFKKQISKNLPVNVHVNRFFIAF